MAPKARRKLNKKSTALGDYERRRDFESTPEPRPKTRRSTKGKKDSARFVVQEHSARRLHWDLRLERDGLAVSWAIPNGIPDDPSENRKAIHTEDHPLKYLEFEGDIPEGQYGAGSMRIWDHGTYECHKWEKEKVIFSFAGERLSGKYALFRAGKSEKDWMIHRIDPPSEGRDPFPDQVVPMLARLSKLPRSEDGWATEIKWDGVRAIAYCRPGRVRLQTRNLRDVTAQYPEVRRLSRQLGARDAVLDGEVVAFDDEGRPSFGRLQQRIHQSVESVVRQRMKSHPVTYVIFDLLYLDGHDLTAEPYWRRREALEQLELAGESWQTPRYSNGQAKALLEASAKRGMEGVLLKRLESPYVPGERPGSWLKVKNTARQEFVIGGWSPGKGRRRETIGALLLGYFEDGEQPAFRYAGKVGTGFSEQDLVALRARLAPLARKTSPFDKGKVPKQACFVDPELVAEIEFRELTSDRMVRHGSFKGLREDKAPTEVVLEQAEMPGQPPQGARGLALDRAKRASRKAAEVTVEGRKLRLSNLDKVLYPKAGFTKGELIDWYARMADVLLPHLRNRPLTMKRYPDGVDAGHFYEKRCPSHRPKWVETAKVWSDRLGKEIDYCLVNSLATLTWAANLADIELHTSLSRIEDMERPTAVVFDLDPGAPAGISDCAQVAVWIKGMLEQLGLDSYAKTSGSKGLQLYVPLNTETSYEETKHFARAVAKTLESKFPERVVAQMAKSKRKGRVLIDWSQNDSHKTTVCVYSLRAKDRPTVSTPVTWHEVEAALEEGDGGSLSFDHADVLRRVEERGDLFAPLLTKKQTIPA
jgi:bifunctional non-homologous end joining protein LigD